MDYVETLSGHLPVIGMVATNEGCVYEAKCSCGWSDPAAHGQAQRAGREYDRHVEDVLSP